MLTKRIRFFREVWEELSKVTWPTRAEAIRMTLTVLVVSIVMAALLGGLDFILTSFIGRILTK